MDRRHFIALGAAGLGSAATFHWLRNRSLAQEPASTAAAPLCTSQNGLLEVDLIAAVSPVQVGGAIANLLSYNGQSPGPRLEACPGDTVRIRLHNRLDQPTNLHYHGLHITPQGTGDNVFVSAAPGETFTYEFTIPADHPAGTFWYHPHHHHHAAEQLFGGVAGLVVIRGELDEIPEVKAAQEEFIILKDFGVDRAGNVSTPNHMNLMMGREGSLVTVNGQVNPGLSIPRGEPQWAAGTLPRLERYGAGQGQRNRAHSRSLPHLCGQDGLPLPHPRPRRPGHDGQPSNPNISPVM